MQESHHTKHSYIGMHKLCRLAPRIIVRVSLLSRWSWERTSKHQAQKDVYNRQNVHCSVRFREFQNKLIAWWSILPLWSLQEVCPRDKYLLIVFTSGPVSVACVATVSFLFPNAREGDENCKRVRKLNRFLLNPRTLFFFSLDRSPNKRKRLLRRCYCLGDESLLAQYGNNNSIGLLFFCFLSLQTISLVGWYRAKREKTSGISWARFIFCFRPDPTQENVCLSTMDHFETQTRTSQVPAFEL